MTTDERTLRSRDEELFTAYLNPERAAIMRRLYRSMPPARFWRYFELFFEATDARGIGEEFSDTWTEADWQFITAHITEQMRLPRVTPVQPAP